MSSSGIRQSRRRCQYLQARRPYPAQARCIRGKEHCRWPSRIYRQGNVCFPLLFVLKLVLTNSQQPHREANFRHPSKERGEEDGCKLRQLRPVTGHLISDFLPRSFNYRLRFNRAANQQHERIASMLSSTVLAKALSRLLGYSRPRASCHRAVTSIEHAT